MASDEGPELQPELVEFQVPEAYIYLPIPPATSYGHRAEIWDVEKWNYTVSLKVVSVGDELVIKLFDKASGELFAECLLPSDGASLTTCVEPVVDSSRYYVLRLVDRTNHKKHAFCGLGFRDRGESSNFSAALDSYRQYLRKKREAEVMRREFEAQEATGSGASSAQHFSLAPGQTIKLELKAVKGSKVQPRPSASTTAASGAALLVHADSLKLKPPPSMSSTQGSIGVSAQPVVQSSGDWAEFDAPPAMRPPSGAGNTDWGDFQS